MTSIKDLETRLDDLPLKLSETLKPVIQKEVLELETRLVKRYDGRLASAETSVEVAHRRVSDSVGTQRDCGIRIDQLNTEVAVLKSKRSQKSESNPPPAAKKRELVLRIGLPASIATMAVVGALTWIFN